jgi:hypothetical protein
MNKQQFHNTWPESDQESTSAEPEEERKLIKRGEERI